MLINLENDGSSYEWLEDWADVPEPEQAQSGWAHHGLAVTRAGEIVGFHPAKSEVVIFDAAGRVSGSWPVSLKEGHRAHPGRGRRQGAALGGRPGDEDTPNLVTTPTNGMWRLGKVR